MKISTISLTARRNGRRGVIAFVTRGTLRGTFLPVVVPERRGRTREVEGGTVVAEDVIVAVAAPLVRTVLTLSTSIDAGTTRTAAVAWWHWQKCTK